MTRRCGKCGASVFLVRPTIKVLRQDPLDPSKDIEVSVNGLGTWHCSNGCKDRTVLVPTYIGAGKEPELRATATGFEVRDEYITALPRRRHIPVLTTF